MEFEFELVVMEDVILAEEMESRRDEPLPNSPSSSLDGFLRFRSNKRK